MLALCKPLTRLQGNTSHVHGMHVQEMLQLVLGVCRRNTVSAAVGIRRTLTFTRRSCDATEPSWQQTPSKLNAPRGVHHELRWMESSSQGIQRLAPAICSGCQLLSAAQHAAAVAATAVAAAAAAVGTILSGRCAIALVPVAEPAIHTSTHT
jgi:hypothetical protein